MINLKVPNLISCFGQKFPAKRTKIIELAAFIFQFPSIIFAFRPIIFLRMTIIFVKTPISIGLTVTWNKIVKSAKGGLKPHSIHSICA